MNSPSVPSGETLANEFLDGTYEVASFEACDCKLPLDRNPLRIALTQFTLFTDPNKAGGDAPRYVSVESHKLFRNARQAASATRRIEQAAAESATEILRRASKLDMPPPEASRVADIRRFLRNVDSDELLVNGAARRPDPEVSDRQLVRNYREWHDDVYEKVLDRDFPQLRQSVADVQNLDQNAEEVIAEALVNDQLGGRFQTLDGSAPKFALLSTFEQVWEPIGYTRGELLSSISLAPGEQATIEIHSWDKQTIKSEEQLESESEFRSAGKLTQREALDVVHEFAHKTTTTINANAGVTLPLVSVGLDAHYTDETSQRQSETVNKVQEQTHEASETLKSLRKTRIELTRETSRDEKQTHSIRNTNRCHALDCLYFEIIANFLVSTRLKSVQPCVLLPNPPITVTPEWVLCHQDVLVEVLLSPIFLSGFEAARSLRIRNKLEGLQHRDDEDTRNFIDPGGAQAKQLMQGILDPYRAFSGLIPAFNGFLQAVRGLWGGAGADVLIGGANEASLGGFVYWGGLGVKARQALAGLDASSQTLEPFDALSGCFRSVKPADFEPAAAPTTIAQGLREEGLHPDLVSALLSSRRLEKLAKDQGLRLAVAAAWQALTGPSITPPTTPSLAQQLESKKADLEQLATAQVDFDRLRCHVEMNLIHYAQAVWARQDPPGRQLWLDKQGPISTAVTSEVVGFVGDKAAYPLVETSAVRQWIDFRPLVTAGRRLARVRTISRTLVSQPTRGTTIETRLSACDACETYIEDSRAIDLRLHTAQALQAEEEAKRRRLRLEVTPPDLSDPAPSPAALSVKLTEAHATPPAEPDA